MNIETQQEISDFVYEASQNLYSGIEMTKELIERQESRVDHFRREKTKKLDDLYKSKSYFIPLDLRKQSFLISSRNLEKELLLLDILKEKLL